VQGKKAADFHSWFSQDNVAVGENIRYMPSRWLCWACIFITENRCRGIKCLIVASGTWDTRREILRESGNLQSWNTGISFLLFCEFDIQIIVHRDIYLLKNQEDALFLEFILVKNSTYFGQIYCPSSGDSTLYTQ